MTRSPGSKPPSRKTGKKAVKKAAQTAGQKTGQNTGQKTGQAGAGNPAAPLAAAAFRQLPLTPPPGTYLGQGALAVFDGRLWLAALDRISVARPEAAAWGTAFESAKAVLTEANAELAERLGHVADGAAARAMGVELNGEFGIGPFALYDGALYAPTRSLWGARLLRMGAERATAGRPGLGLEWPAEAGAAMSNLCAAGGWLATAPSPLMPKERHRGPVADDVPVRVLVSRAPAADAWREAAAPGFGAGVTGGVTALAMAHDHLYAAVHGADRGFELWRAKPEESLPWRWERVIERGGHRFSQAPLVTTMTGFGEALYLAAGISESGYGKDYAGPAAAEILRVDAAGDWDLIMGQPRFTPQGLKVPLSGLGPGFGDGFASVVPTLAVHEGVLYAGTRHTRGEYAIRQEGETRPEQVAEGGAALWASADGEGWTPVFEGGNGNAAATAVRALCSTPEGLYMVLAINTQILGLQIGMADTGPAGDEIEIWRAV